MLIEAPIENLFPPSSGTPGEGRGGGDSAFDIRHSTLPTAPTLTLPRSTGGGDEKESHIDWLDLSWDECTRRAIRKKSRGGRLIRTLLKLGTVLRHGDVLFEDSQIIVAVNLLPCEVLIAEPKSSIEFASIAYKLGDLHVPMEISDSEMITLCDGPTQAAFHELGITSRTETRRFQPTLRSTTVMTLAHDFELLHTR